MSGHLILLRHGQSVWNAENRFTGWVDVGLTDVGSNEARRAGQILADSGILVDAVHTSLLTRAIMTTDIALEQAGRLWLTPERTWRLNERHYGALAGLDKNSTIERYGIDQVHLWRRSYLERPPAVEDITEFRNDPRYRNLSDTELPRGESLADVQARLLPYWTDRIAPQLAAGMNVLIGAHGNSLRALVKHIEQIDDRAVADLEIATGTPRHYEVTGDTMDRLTFSSARTLVNNA